MDLYTGYNCFRRINIQRNKHNLPHRFHCFEDFLNDRIINWADRKGHLWRVSAVLRQNDKVQGGLFLRSFFKEKSLFTTEEKLWADSQLPSNLHNFAQLILRSFNQLPFVTQEIMDIAAAGAANQASHPGRHCGASPDDSFNRDCEETTHVAHDSGYKNKFEKRSYSGELRPVEHPNVGHDGNSHKTDCESSGGSEGKDRQPKNQVDNGTSGGLVQRGPTLRRDISRNSDNEVYRKEYERSNRQPCAVQLGTVDEEPPLGSAQKGSDVLLLHDTTTRNYTASNPPQIERLLLGEGPIGNTDFTSSATNGNILWALEAVGFKENHIDDDSLGLSILVEKELPIWTSDLRTTKVERYLGCWTAKEEVNLWLLKGRDGMIWVVDEYKQSYRLDEDYQKIVAFLQSRL